MPPVLSVDPPSATRPATVPAWRYSIAIIAGARRARATLCSSHVRAGFQDLFVGCTALAEPAPA
jgi:hypothetical protein